MMKWYDFSSNGAFNLSLCLVVHFGSCTTRHPWNLLLWRLLTCTPFFIFLLCLVACFDCSFSSSSCVLVRASSHSCHLLAMLLGHKPFISFILFVGTRKICCLSPLFFFVYSTFCRHCAICTHAIFFFRWCNTVVPGIGSQHNSCKKEALHVRYSSELRGALTLCSSVIDERIRTGV